MSTKQGSNKGKTRNKKTVPDKKITEAIKDPIQLDDGPDVTGGLGGEMAGEVKEMLELPAIEDEQGLLEPGPGEVLEPGDMTSLNEGAVRKSIPEKTLKRMDKLIQCLRQYGNPTRAAQAAGITRSLAYGWKAMYPGFSKVWTMAMNMAIDDLEAEARRRAFEGVLKPAGWYKGQAGGRVREYSDLLLMFLLKAHRPDKFKDRIEATGAGVLGLKVQITDYSHVGEKPGQIPNSSTDIKGKDQQSNTEGTDG